MQKTLLVFDSHPVQYRVPIWQIMERRFPGNLHVVYGSDCSVRGHVDSGFGRAVAWDDPMLDGYANTVLNCEKGKPLSGWGSLTGKGVKELFDQLTPKAVLLTGLNYRYDLVAFYEARRRGIPVWLRCETQDDALRRSKGKYLLRSLLYRSIYWGFKRVFYIGELNRNHYLRHGVAERKLRPARYGTLDRFINLSTVEKQALRASARRQAGLPDDAFIVGFSGKFIPKKHPEILFQMLQMLRPDLRRRTYLYFIGSGELEETLHAEADSARQQWGVQSFFAGFVNQSELAAHYLAMDVLVLPSRRQGETWGLVANEAMQAGCGVVVSDAVGCGADFGKWERFRIFREGDAPNLATCLTDLFRFPRNFDWATELLKAYSLEATATALLTAYEGKSLIQNLVLTTAR